MPNALQHINTLLIDLDGTLYIDNTPIAGAVSSVSQLQKAGYKTLFLTNTTTKTAAQIASHMQNMGFTVKANQILTAPMAAVNYLNQLQQSQPNLSIWAVVHANVLGEFANFTHNNQNPNFVVIGDIGEAWNYTLLNQIFNAVINGAQIIALHKNKYWQTDSQLHVDIGLFIAGLEYTTNKPAIVLGKPSPTYFVQALQILGSQPQDTLVVGDDIESDIGGAQQAGCVGVLVKTGKYRQVLVEQSAVKANFVVDDIHGIVRLLNSGD